MGRVMKSILSLLLALAIAASIGCVPAFADADGGNSNAEGGGAIQVTVIVGSAEAGQGTVTEVKVGGITIDESTPSAVCSGVSVTYAESGSSQTITVGGPIETVDCAGLTVNNENTGTPIVIEIKGDVTGACGGVSANTESPGTSETTVNIQGNVIVPTPTEPNGDGGGVGVNDIDSTVKVSKDVINNSPYEAVVATGSAANVTINGGVTANGTCSTAIDASDGAAVQTGDKVTATGLGVKVTAGDGTSVEIGGDLKAGSAGIWVDLAGIALGEGGLGADPLNGTGAGDSTKKTSVTVEGTLAVGEGMAPILQGAQVSADDVELTVWKIEIGDKAPEEGNIVIPANEDGSPEQNVTEAQREAAEELEKNINYVIRIDPRSCDNLSSSKNSAHAFETVKVTVTVPSGQRLKAVYIDEGRSLTAKDNGDGSFTLTVPVGGGVLVYADMEDEPAPPVPPAPPAPNPESGLSSASNAAGIQSIAAGMTAGEVQNLVAKGTVDGETVTMPVYEVLTYLVKSYLKRMVNNSILNAAFDPKNSKILECGRINFQGVFDNAEEETIIVPLRGSYYQNKPYTVVIGNGTVLQITCKENGLLDVPFPKTAQGLGYVVLRGSLEDNQPVKAALCSEAYAAAIAAGKSEFYANAYAAAIGEGKTAEEAQSIAAEAEAGIPAAMGTAADENRENI